MWEPQLPETLRALSGIYRDWFALTHGGGVNVFFSFKYDDDNSDTLELDRCTLVQKYAVNMLIKRVY
jgi:hypothetical protein